MENSSLTKLKSIARFLNLSGRFLFQNFNLKLFNDFLETDPELSSIVASLLQRFPQSSEMVREVLNGRDNRIAEVRTRIHSFDEWVAFCIAYIREVGLNGGNRTIDRFVIPVDQGTHATVNEDRKQQFYNECIEPILIYIELQVKEKLNALYILQRYKILCEWYERVEIFSLKETILTQKHLSKYLFDQGFTYSLSETSVPSGRIDNLALSIGLTGKEQFAALPNAIVAEAKIFDGTEKDILDVKNQILKRINDLGFEEGFAIIFNKSDKKLNLAPVAGYTSGVPFLTDETHKKIYVLTINLHEIFYESTAEIKEREIVLTNGN